MEIEDCKKKVKFHCKKSVSLPKIQKEFGGIRNSSKGVIYLENDGIIKLAGSYTIEMYDVSKEIQIACRKKFEMVDPPDFEITKLKYSKIQFSLVYL